MKKPREFWIEGFPHAGASTGWACYRAYDCDMKNPKTPIHVQELIYINEDELGVAAAKYVVEYSLYDLIYYPSGKKVRAEEIFKDGARWWAAKVEGK